jgi:DNA-binding winged helix-turn-helix (wHTH) protein
VHLRPKLIDLLEFLASNQGRVVGKDEILQRVWHGEFVVESVLGRSIADLRRVLEDDVASPRIIETIPKRGYRLIAPVREAGGPSLPSGPSIAVLPFSTSRRDRAAVLL